MRSARSQSRELRVMAARCPSPVFTPPADPLSLAELQRDAPRQLTLAPLNLSDSFLQDQRRRLIQKNVRYVLHPRIPADNSVDGCAVRVLTAWPDEKTTHFEYRAVTFLPVRYPRRSPLGLRRNAQRV